ncbi:hypothetical protein HHL16_22890 [Pseudoflavitalea sp. G-6-1-2]|uniref:hypothetical protein n=1 Tax=Pseudoflavitalea sp. G-6-1-2 TaxID=2728841 RepID=UPI00146B33F0|nr:hypothetical protein [Pseudoflavitalea sp. G-6-1-2]NML23746.1 hypothetical protein [Pseudoflavitalea sp. G-6-1-2]
MKVILFLCALVLVNNLQAQFWKEKLNQAKELAKQKGEQKIDQKIQDGIDQGLEKTDSVVSGKKKISILKKKKTGNKNGKEADQPGQLNSNGEYLIKTDINCEAGKRLISNMLEEEEGIESITINIETGLVTLIPVKGQTDVYNKVVDIICKTGFTADKKRIGTKTNPCQ